MTLNKNPLSRCVSFQNHYVSVLPRIATASLTINDEYRFRLIIRGVVPRMTDQNGSHCGMLILHYMMGSPEQMWCIAFLCIIILIRPNSFVLYCFELFIVLIAQSLIHQGYNNDNAGISFSFIFENIFQNKMFMFCMGHLTHILVNDYYLYYLTI